MTPSPIFLPLRELAALVRARRVSPVALTEEFLERLETLGPRYNAVVTVTRERALREASRPRVVDDEVPTIELETPARGERSTTAATIDVAGTYTGRLSSLASQLATCCADTSGWNCTPQTASPSRNACVQISLRASSTAPGGISNV